MIAPSSENLNAKRLAQLARHEQLLNGSPVVPLTALLKILGWPRELVRSLIRRGDLKPIYGPKHGLRPRVYFALDNIRQAISCSELARCRRLRYGGLSHKSSGAQGATQSASALELIRSIRGAVIAIRLAEGDEQDTESMCQRIDDLCGVLPNHVSVRVPDLAPQEVADVG